MEAEADVADLALCLSLFHMGKHIELEHMTLPAVGAEGMHQVAVDVVGLQALQLLIEDSFKILLAGHPGHRNLAGQGHLLPVTAGQGNAGGHFTAGIDISGVHIVQAVVNGLAQGLVDPCLIDLIVFVLLQAHHAEAKGKMAAAGAAKFAVFHM